MTSSFLILIMLLRVIISLLCSSIILVNAQLHIPSYKDCAPSYCGNSIIRYPLGKCGLLSARCENNETTRLYLPNDHDFSWTVVGDITESSYNSFGTLQIDPYHHLTDSADRYDWLMMGGFFNLAPGYIAATIFQCTERVDEIKSLQRVNLTWIDCREAHGSYCYFHHSAADLVTKNLSTIESCRSYRPIIVPANVSSYNISADTNFEGILQNGFHITWSIPHDCLRCQATRDDQYPFPHSQPTQGRCLSYFFYNDFIEDAQNYVDYCVCANDTVHHFCNDGSPMDLKTLYANANGSREGISGGRRSSLKQMAEISVPVCAVLSMVLVYCIVLRRQICYKRTTSEQEQQSVETFMDPLDSRTPSIENFLNYYSSQLPTRYSYAQIRAYTNNLADKIGKGGFGTVYKGKLPSGRLIAVKMLDESKQSEQQFIAEVATVGRTYHINLVRLLGYCFQGSKRALVYEYIVNGSLDKYIHGGHEAELDWKQLYSIAVGIARGIAYLHEDCKNRILHCDIKPHNVLLDAEFLPKVADFGLAKISNRGKSHISVANRGTLGYAAPEMWSRMYGSVTDKSDVYSYGMLLLEMVGKRKNLDFNNEESRSSKFYYPKWAFKQVEMGEFRNLREENMSEEDEEIAKKLSLIGLWCIQFNASGRPRMSKVIQMLEGVIDIDTPPFPFPFDTPLQPSTSNLSSSTSTSALDVEMINPTITLAPTHSGESSTHSQH